MKDPRQLLQTKLSELNVLVREIDMLKIVIPMLVEESDNDPQKKSAIINTHPPLADAAKAGAGGGEVKRWP